MSRLSRRAAFARSTRLSGRHAIALAVLGSPLLATSADAASKYWDGGDDTGANGANVSWSTATNWLGDTNVVASDDLIFQSARSASGTSGYATATVATPLALNGNILAHSILFDGSLGKLPSALAINSNSSGTTTRTLTLTGDSNGSTTLLAMTGYSAPASVAFNSNGTTGTMSVILGSSGTINVADVGSNLTIGGVISDGGNTFGLVKTGSGTLTLNGSNTFVGGVTVNGGTISLASTTGLGNADGSGFNTTTLNGGTLLFTAGGLTASYIRQFNLGPGGGTFNFTNGNWQFNGIISGSGGLTKTGSGNLTLAPQNSGGTYVNNTYTGATNIAGGQLNFATERAFASTSGINFAAGTTLSYSNSTSSATPTISVPITIAGSTGTGGTVLIGTGSNQLLTLSGNISGSGQLIKGGTGTLSLSGTNSYQGGTAVNAGTLRVTTTNAVPNGIIDLASGTTFDYQNSVSYGSLPAGVTFRLASGSETLLFNGGSSGNPNQVFTLSGGVSGNGALIKAGSATLILGGSNSYAGTTTINGGTLVFQRVDSLPATSAVTVGAGMGIGFGVGGAGQFGLSELTTARNAATYLGSSSLALDTTAAATTFLYNTAITTPAAGSLTLVKLGSGTLTLSASNTYTGGTVINNGTLQIGNGGTTGTVGSGDVAIGVNGALAVNRSDDLTINNVITGSGAVVKNGSNSLSFGSTSNTFANLTVNAGRVSFFNTLQLAGNNAGTISLGDGTTLRFNSSAGGTLSASKGIALPNTAPGSATIETTAADVQLTVAGVVSGNSGTLIKTGAGTLYLSNLSNTFTGGVTINAGTVRFAGGGSLGANTSPSATINNGGILQYDSTSNANFAATRSVVLNGGLNGINVSNTGVFAIGYNYALGTFGSATLSGSGTLVKLGSGTLGLQNANSYTGGTIVSDGILAVRQVNGLNGGDVSFNPVSGATAQLDIGAATQAIASLANSGAGTSRVLLGYGPGFTGYAGGGGAATTLTVGSGDISTTYSGVITDRSATTAGAIGNVVKTGAGSLTLTGVNTYTGTTTVSGGLLVADTPVASGSSTGSGAVAINSGGELAGAGNVAGEVTVNDGGVITAGTGATAASVPGTLTTGNQTWNSGGTYVWKTTSSTGTAGTTWDLLNMGSLTANSGFIVQAILGTTSGNIPGTFEPPTMVEGEVVTYQLAHTTNTSAIDISGFVLDVAALGIPSSTGHFTLSFDPGSGGGYDLNLNYEAAPEPTTAALVGLAASSLLGRRRRKAGGRSVFGLLGRTH